MAIPDFQTLMLPLLKFVSDQKEHTSQEAIDVLALEFGLTEREKNSLLPSGRQSVFVNRIAWAKSYLKQAGLIESPRRGFSRITPEGQGVLQQSPSRITIKFLEQFPEFLEFRARGKKEAPLLPNNEIALESPPEELLEAGYQALRSRLVSDLIQQVKTCSPRFFEKLVMELLVKMGYGSNLKDAGRLTGRSADEGIDGIINEDKLGLDVIYIQAKKWEGPVSRPEIQKFAGALLGQKAKKGVFITTSSFTGEAKDFAAKLDSKIVLIDGELLAQLMIDYNLAVSTIATYEIKRVDSDYFIEE